MWRLYCLYRANPWDALNLDKTCWLNEQNSSWHPLEGPHIASHRILAVHVWQRLLGPSSSTLASRHHRKPHSKYSEANQTTWHSTQWLSRKQIIGCHGTVPWHGAMLWPDNPDVPCARQNMMCQLEKSPWASFIPHHSPHLWRWGCWERGRRSMLSGLPAHSYVCWTANFDSTELLQETVGSWRAFVFCCVQELFSQNQHQFVQQSGTDPFRKIKNSRMLWFACMPQAKLIQSEEYQKNDKKRMIL